MASFDPYHIWLGIPPEDQPPSHYRLLGIAELESNLDVIDAATEQRTIFLRTFQAGDQAALAEQLLNEISAARVCLLNAEQKAEYDQQLEAEMQSAPVSTPAIRQPSRRRRETQPIWKQPRMLAAAGSIVAVALLLVIVSSGGDKPQPKVLPRETQEEREEEVKKLVEEIVKQELLKAEQERPAALTAEEEKATNLSEAEIKRLVGEQVKEELLKAEQERPAALTAEEELLKAYPGVKTPAEFFRGVVALAEDNISKGNFDVAIIGLEEAIRRKPDLGIAYYHKGLAHAKKGNHQRATVDFTKAIALNQDGPGFLAASYHWRASSYGFIRKLNLAIEDYTKAINLYSEQNKKTELAKAYFGRGLAKGQVQGEADRAKARALGYEP
jgi:tetratricopeptide (TPR) repeat protein